jgi:hypothetical protein
MLAAKKIGDVPTSAGFPFFPAFAMKAGFGMGLHDYVVAKPEARQRGPGFGETATLGGMVDLVMQYVATPEMKRPAVESWYYGEFGGRVTLSPAQGSAVDARVGEYGKLLA